MEWKSAEINEIAAALARAQGKVLPVKKDGTNPYYGSRYATLDACREACREVLASEEISVIQKTKTENVTVRVNASQEGDDARVSEVSVSRVFVQTVLSHSSGQWLSDEGLTVTARDTSPQAVGSAITYARRYGLSAMLGLTPESDDDGEMAQRKQAPATKKKTPNKKPPRPQKKSPATEAIEGKAGEILDQNPTETGPQNPTDNHDPDIPEGQEVLTVTNVCREMKRGEKYDGTTWERGWFKCEEYGEQYLNFWSSESMPILNDAHTSGLPISCGIDKGEYNGKPQFTAHDISIAPF